MLSPGGRAPAFHLKDVSGTVVSLATLLEQGPVLLVFFKIGCPTCQYTLPFLQRLENGSAVSVVGISQDEAGPTSAFCRAYGIEFRVLLDRASERYPASNAYGITTVPTQILVGSDGIIAQAFNGFSRNDLEFLARPLGFTLFQAHEQTPEFRPG